MNTLQYSDYSRRMNGSLGKLMRLLMIVLLVATVLVAGNATIEHFLPSVEMVEVSYPYDIRAEVFYNPYMGVPLVTSDMTYMELEFAQYVDSVNWLVPPDAQAYYIVSIVQADSTGIENYLNMVSQP